MSFDALKNFSYGQVLGAPIPAGGGTSLTLAAGQGAAMPAPPFNAVVWPAAAIPLSSNAEIVRVTNIVGDVLTITRQQEGTSARAVIVGDQFMAAITAKTLTDIQNAIPSSGCFAGNGSPEGVQTAGPGSTYTDVQAVPSEFWLKITGTGNTGWEKKLGA